MIVPEFLAGRDDSQCVRRTPGTGIMVAEEPCLAVQNPGSEIAFHFAVGQFHQRIIEKTRQPEPLPLHVAQGFAEVRFGLCIADGRLYPRFQFGDQRSAVALPSLEPLSKVFTSALRFGIHVKELGVDPQTFNRAMVAAAQRSDKAAPSTRVAPSALAPARWTQLFVGEASHIALTSR